MAEKAPRVKDNRIPRIHLRIFLDSYGFLQEAAAYETRSRQSLLLAYCIGLFFASIL